MDLILIEERSSGLDLSATKAACVAVFTDSPLS